VNILSAVQPSIKSILEA